MAVRSDRQILDDLVDAVLCLMERGDAESDFYDEHGRDAAYWDDEDEREHDAIVAEVLECRSRARGLIREATGDDGIEL